MRPGVVILVLWILWLLSWLAAAGWSARTAKRAGVKAQGASIAILALGAALILTPAHGYRGPLRLWHIDLLGAWLCVALVLAGVVFAWWARIHLGRLWSGSVTLKAGHRVVDTGPYRLVRHPIYTGILLAILGTAAAKGTLWGLLGAAVVTLGLWMKARAEERWLSQELGGAYDGYKQRVPMLLPFRPKDL